jgi:nondiscriminating glutamyl-tRNA synthetase
VAYDPQAVQRYFHGARTAALLRGARRALADATPFDVGTIETAVRAAAGTLRVESKALIHPLRVALTGKTVGPGLFELVEVLGKDRALHRLDRAIQVAEAAG